jgi:hypothetical protein
MKFYSLMLSVLTEISFHIESFDVFSTVAKGPNDRLRAEGEIIIDISVVQLLE